MTRIMTSKKFVGATRPTFSMRYKSTETVKLANLSLLPGSSSRGSSTDQEHS